MIVYRGFARNAESHAGTVVRPERDVAAGGILSRDPAAAHDAVFNQYGRDPVLNGESQGGVVAVTIPASLWNELVRSHSLSERGAYPGFSRRLDTTEIRVNSAAAARAINGCDMTVLPPNPDFDYRPGADLDRAVRGTPSVATPDTVGNDDD